ncbi:MAG: hypothetical protein WBG70_07555, partial [Spirulinaceae cyanobacterium]
MAQEYTEQSFEPTETDYYQERNNTATITNMATMATKEDLINYLGKSDRTIRTWIKTAKEVYHWLPKEELSIRQGKRILYTQFTLEQLENIKAHIEVGGNLDSWKAGISEPVSSPVSIESEQETKVVEYSVASEENPYAITVEPLPERPKLIKYEPKNFEVPECLRQPTINQKLDNLLEIATAQTEAE